MRSEQHPIPVDVDVDTALIDIDRALDAITPRTGAIVVGPPLRSARGPVAPDSIPGWSVVEDAAQAHGAIVEPVGHAVTYSFYPTKNIGGIGDGGAVVTADPDLAAAIRRRRVHGMTEQYVHVEVSQNFRMSELEAAWLRLQLPSLGDGQRPAGDDRQALPVGRAAPDVAVRSPRPRLPPVRRPIHRS